MSVFLASFLLLVSLDPDSAVEWAVRFELGHDSPRLVRQLQRIAHRESRSKRIGLHPNDKWAGPIMWRRAVRASLLAPETCPFHRADTQAEKEEWAPRGAWGLSAAYNSKYLPGCYPAALFDIPAVSALVALRKLRANRQDPRRAWSGRRKCDRRRAKWGSCKARKR